MRKLIFVIGLLILWSCGNDEGKSTASGSFDFTVEIDTVMVDAGNEIMMAGSNMFLSDLSHDHSTLFNFDWKSRTLEIIDLDQLRLVEKVTFQNEGPDAVSSYVSNLKIYPDGNLAIMSFGNNGVFTPKGKKIKDLPLDPNIYFEEGHENGLIFRKEMVFLDENTVLSTMASIEKLDPRLVIVHMDKKKLSFIDFPPLTEQEKYIVILQEPYKSNYLGTNYFDIVKNKVITSSNFFNRVYLLNTEIGDFEEIKYYSKLTSNEKKEEFNYIASSPEDFENTVQLINQQINFGRMVWDDSNSRFYRLSYYNLPKIEGEEIKSKVYLTVFDENFEMLGEKMLNEYIKPPLIYFAKDGAIWLHENVNDELGFIRIKVLEN